MNYTIEQVGPSKTVQGKYGELKIYTIKLQNETDWVELSQKTDSPTPTVGQQLEGHIESTQYGKRFKKEFGGGGQGFRGTSNTNSDRQVALNAAAIFHNSITEDVNAVLATAILFLEWLKGSSPDLPPVDQLTPPGDLGL